MTPCSLVHYRDLEFCRRLAMSQTVSRRSVTAEARFHPGPVLAAFLIDKVALGQVFLVVLQLTFASVTPQPVTCLLPTLYFDNR